MDYTTKDCPFCFQKDEIEIIAENEFAFASFDIYPVNPGHVLIVTRRHIQNFFETTSEEKQALFSLLEVAKKIIDERFNPSGYNIGININSVAGQTVPHVHIHLIPRYPGDVENPRGGVRQVIPDKGIY